MPHPARNATVGIKVSQGHVRRDVPDRRAKAGRLAPGRGGPRTSRPTSSAAFPVLTQPLPERCALNLKRAVEPSTLFGFRVSGFQGFWVSGFQGFKVSGFLGFRVSGFQGFWVSGFQGFRVSRFHRGRDRYRYRDRYRGRDRYRDRYRDRLFHHRLTVSPPHSLTASQSHRLTVSQPHSLTASQPHSLTASQPHRL